MKFFDWVILIDCVSVLTIGWLILALSMSWRAEQSHPDSAPVMRDLTSALGRGIFGYLPIRAVLEFVSSQRRRIARIAPSVKSRVRGTVVPEGEPGRVVGGLSDVVATE